MSITPREVIEADWPSSSQSQLSDAACRLAANHIFSCSLSESLGPKRCNNEQLHLPMPDHALCSQCPEKAMTVILLYTGRTTTTTTTSCLTS